MADDLGLTQDAAEQSLPDEPEPLLIATSVDSDAALSDEQLDAREPGLTWIPASEPSPVTTIALGCAFLGAAGILHRRRTERRRARRRALVRIRAIIASR